MRKVFANMLLLFVIGISKIVFFVLTNLRKYGIKLGEESFSKILLTKIIEIGYYVYKVIYLRFFIIIFFTAEQNNFHSYEAELHELRGCFSFFLTLINTEVVSIVHIFFTYCAKYFLLHTTPNTKKNVL